jgi:hypothetical protein
MPPRKELSSRSLFQITQRQLETLPQATAAELLRVADNVDRRSARHALWAIILGTL